MRDENHFSRISYKPPRRTPNPCGAVLFRFLLAVFAFPILSPQVSSQSFEGCEMPGYRGIWFTLGQRSEFGDKYSGGLGTYTANHLPVAIYHKETRRTYFVYGGTIESTKRHLLVMVSYFDHRTRTFPRPVVVMDKGGVDDPHDNASLSIDREGHLWVFVSGRGRVRPGKVYRSVRPHDIGSFREVYSGEFTYPQPWSLGPDGFLLLYTRYTDGRELYVRRFDAQGVPGPERKLAGMGGHYQLSLWDGSRVLTAFNHHPGGDVDRRTNLYVMQSRDSGQHWTTIQGDSLDLPLRDIETPALVRDYVRGGKLLYLNDLTLDRRGNPVILAVVSRHHQPGPKGDPREWYVLQYRDGRWVEHFVCRSTHNYDMGSLYVEGCRWRIIGPTEPGPQPYGTGGEMAVWESRDEGRHWRRTRMLTQGSRLNHSYARRPLQAHRRFYSFWADGDADSLSASHLFYMLKKGRVFRLPYSMEKPEGRAERWELSGSKPMFRR